MSSFKKNFPATAAAFRRYRRRFLLTTIANRLSWDKNACSSEIIVLLICAYIPSHIVALFTSSIWKNLLLFTSLLSLSLAAKCWASWYEKRESVICGVALGGQDRYLAGVLSLFLYQYKRSSNPDPAVVEAMSDALPLIPIAPDAYQKLPRYQQLVCDETRKLKRDEW